MKNSEIKEETLREAREFVLAWKYESAAESEFDLDKSDVDQMMEAGYFDPDIELAARALHSKNVDLASREQTIEEDEKIIADLSGTCAYQKHRIEELEAALGETHRQISLWSIYCESLGQHEQAKEIEEMLAHIEGAVPLLAECYKAMREREQADAEKTTSTGD